MSQEIRGATSDIHVEEEEKMKKELKFLTEQEEKEKNE